jgi:hypothetical protein
VSVVKAPGVAWHKSSACLPSECVEVASIDGHVLIRDSSVQVGGTVLVFTRDHWLTFLRRLGHAGLLRLDRASPC